jgi:hypothetical protein
MTEEEQTNQTTPEEESTTYEGKYCNSDDVASLFSDISDEPSCELIKTAIDNSEGLINSKLRGAYVLIPTDVPSSLKTCSIYLSASDVLLSLYHGEELPVQYDIYWNKAHELLDAYIEDMRNNAEDAEELDKINIVKHSNALTYNEKRRVNNWRMR